MMRSVIAAGGLALAGMAAAPATASTVELELLSMPNSSLVSAQVGGVEVEPRGAFGAGSFEMQETSTLESFLAWCLEVTQVLNPDPTEYSTASSLLTPEKETLVSKLFTGFLGRTGNDIGAAAFQLALWEIVEETGDALNLRVGEFTAQAGNDRVIRRANRFLRRLDDYDANYRISYFQNADSQDIITAAPIPLPASVLLLGAGIGGLAFVSRRRKAKSAQA